MSALQGASTVALVNRRTCESAAPFVIALLLHAVLLVVAAWFTGSTATPPRAERSVSIDILTAKQYDEIADRAKTQEPPREKPVEPVATAPPSSPAPVQDLAPPQGALVWRQATQMFSAPALSEPGNKKAADRLKMLETATRLQQLCDFEAMLQIGRADGRFKPDFVVAYAMADAKTDRNEIIADGAAFHSDGQWYNLAFRCRMSARQEKVQAFEFAVGALIPQRDWAPHNLPTNPSGAGDE